MTRFHLDFIPRASWQPETDPADQRWTRTPNIFSGTEDEATLECSELESEYGYAVTFRAVVIELTPEDEGLHHYCPSCGGDYRERMGQLKACSCPLAIASTTGIRWSKPARAS